MTSISSHTVVLNVSGPQRTVVRVKPVTQVERIEKPKPVIEDTKVVRVVHASNKVETVVRPQTVTEIKPTPEISKRQSAQTVVQSSSSTTTTQSIGGNVDIYV